MTSESGEIPETTNRSSEASTQRSNTTVVVHCPSQERFDEDQNHASPSFGEAVGEALARSYRDGLIAASSTSPASSPSPCPTTIIVDQNAIIERTDDFGDTSDFEDNHQWQGLEHFSAPTGSLSACNTPIPRKDTPCGSSRFSTQAVCTPSPSNVTSSAKITLNPLFESASFVKKKIITKLRSFRGDDAVEDNIDDDEAQTKSLSIDSYYITPTTVNEEEAAEKIIQATNYFIISALVASFFLGILIIWLLAGKGKS